MGTKMAPSHANLFMGKFEQEALAAAPHSPLIWWCYIDDIFFPWTHGEDKLNDSITYLNNLHLTIKFTSSFSYNEIPFLDVKVMLLVGRLESVRSLPQTHRQTSVPPSIILPPMHLTLSNPFPSTWPYVWEEFVQQTSSSTHVLVRSQHTLWREDIYTVSLTTQ